MLNTMVAEELSQFYVELKGAQNINSAVRSLVRNVLTEHQRIIFNGDNYADEWVEEAQKRGLYNLKSLPDAFAHFLDRKNIDLFVKNKIVTEAEYRARYEIELETYCKQINIEALTMIDMAKKKITPAVTAFVRELTKLVCFVKKTSELEDAVMNAGDASSDPLERARYFRENIFAKMQELRAVGDSMETETSSDFWPYPSYTELLFGV